MCEKPENITAAELAQSFKQFLFLYEIFRTENNLSAKIDNKYEITTSLADKVGRICRQVKHFERNDPKPDWPKGISEDITGVLIYLVILMNSYELDISEGLINELNKAVEQHSSGSNTLNFKCDPNHYLSDHSPVGEDCSSYEDGYCTFEGNCICKEKV